MAKRKKKRELPKWLTEKPIEYTDIGHRSPGAIVWVINYGNTVEARSIRDGTHNSIWGIKALGMWRGRFDPDTKPPKLSIVPPATYQHRHTPQAVLDLLEAAFGVDIEIVDFNPRRK